MAWFFDNPYSENARLRPLYIPSPAGYELDKLVKIGGRKRWLTVGDSFRRRRQEVEQLLRELKDRHPRERYRIRKV